MCVCLFSLFPGFILKRSVSCVCRVLGFSFGLHVGLLCPWTTVQVSLSFVPVCLRFPLSALSVWSFYQYLSCFSCRRQLSVVIIQLVSCLPDLSQLRVPSLLVTCQVTHQFLLCNPKRTSAHLACSILHLA